jgi:hypothetical protein
MNPIDVVRFWDKVKVAAPDECWEWQGAIDSNGYGAFKIEGKKRNTHRIAFDLCFGPIPDGKLICHHCDNRKCVNPVHLFIGTQVDNMQDCSRKGRLKVPTSIAYGEAAGGAKLTAAMVIELRLLYNSKKYTYRKLGKLFGIDPKQAWNIVNRISWKHI